MDYDTQPWEDDLYEQYPPKDPPEWHNDSPEDDETDFEDDIDEDSRYEMTKDLRLGVPHARVIDAQVVECQQCGVWIICSERKDFESFTKVEYLNHLKATH